MEDKHREKGLYNKYFVSRTDGKEIPAIAEFFCLRLDELTEPKHREACIAAVLTYATHIEPHLPELAKDLRFRYDTRHDWGLSGGPGVYEDTYKCAKCGITFTEHYDVPNSPSKPEFGCKSPRDLKTND